MGMADLPAPSVELEQQVNWMLLLLLLCLLLPMLVVLQKRTSWPVHLLLRMLTPTLGAMESI